MVTPFTGVWIEIEMEYRLRTVIPVTPFTGVWIEIISLICAACIRSNVTPFTGVWIEIWMASADARKR